MADQPQSEWFKSSYSGSPNDDCVECKYTPQNVHVRDSKDPDGPRFAFSPEAWASFTDAVRDNSLIPR